MKKNLIYLSLLTILIIVLSKISREVLKVDNLYYLYLLEKLSKEQVKKYLLLQQKMEYISYSFIFLLFLFKTLIISTVLYIGAFFFSKSKIYFKDLFFIVTKTEFVFVFVAIFKIIWFYFFENNYTLVDIQQFYPLSALNIIGYQELDSWFIYPLQTLNLFELVYWMVLSYFIGKLAFSEKDKGKPMDLGFKIVASSYGTALFLWVAVVMFFTLNYS